MIKDSTQEKTEANILVVVAKFDILAAKMERLYHDGQTVMHKEGKLLFHTQKELLLGLSGMRGSILSLKKALLGVVDAGKKAGEDIIHLMVIASYTSMFLIEKNLMDEFKIFVESKTGNPVKPAGILQKIKFWRR